MAWVKLDDGYFFNRKVRVLSPTAMLLDVAAFCFCAKAENDGSFGAHDVPLVAALCKLDDVSAELEELIKAGRWKLTDNGYRVHDFLVYNPSHVQLQAQRESTKERVAKFRAGKRNSVTNAVTSPVSNGPCTSAPYPIPSGSPLSLSASGSGARVATGGPIQPDTAYNLVWCIKAAVEKAQPGHGMWAPDTFAQENASRLLVGLGDTAKAMPELERKIGMFAADPEMQPWTVKKFCDQYNGIGHEKPGRAGQPRAVHHPRLGGS